MAAQDAPASQKQSEAPKPSAQKTPPKQFTLPEVPPQPLVAPPVVVEPPPPDLAVLPDTPPPVPGTAGGESALLGRGRIGERLDRAVVIRALLGFVVFFVLAYVAGHPTVLRLEGKFLIGPATAMGLPFVLLGLAAAQPSVGVLTPNVLEEAAPLLPLGLGWIGFVVGTRFETRRFEQISPDSEASVFLTTAAPVLLILAACSLVVYPLGLLPRDTPGLLRDGLLLSVAGAMVARTSTRLLAGEANSSRLVRIVELEQLAGVLGLLFVSVFFRPPSSMVGWQLPSTAWLFVTLGIGTALGLIIWAILTRMHSPAHFAALLLGAVAFCAGMASFLRLSSLSVCFIAGAVIINIGGSWKEEFRSALERLERPVYLIFLVIAGALWSPADPRGWVLMALFLLGRFAAKWLSVRLVSRYWIPDLSVDEKKVLAIAPMGALSIAIVVSAQDLYSGSTVPLIVTAIIGGSVFSEVLLQLVWRKAAPKVAPA